MGGRTGSKSGTTGCTGVLFSAGGTGALFLDPAKLQSLNVACLRISLNTGPVPFHRWSLPKTMNRSFARDTATFISSRVLSMKTAWSELFP